MEPEDLRRRIEQAGGLTDVRLADLAWPDAAAEDADFDGCEFARIVFADAPLQGARFRRCRFVRCRFSHAELRGAVFEDCSFTDPDEAAAGCVFAFSRLRDARLSRCDLAFAVFERSELHNVEIDRCSLLGARFDRADFSHAYGRKSVSTRAIFRECNLELADLSGAKLMTCDLSGSRMRETCLAGADLTDADLRDCDLFQADFAKARLAGADLRGAAISGLDLIALESFQGLRITPEQQHLLLTAIGVEVDAPRSSKPKS